MKERPILFQGEMVRAILAGRKTQTRRIVKPPSVDWTIPEPCTTETSEGWQGPIDRSLWADQGDQNDGESRRCPYGKPGDRLWVRETFGFYGKEKKVLYRADDFATTKWKPSIFMPRAFSRIILEITDVRVERLISIRNEDALAEGCPEKYDHHFPRQWYRDLWIKINGQESWDMKPWVWVIEFKRV